MVKHLSLQVLAHRGLWYEEKEHNTTIACERALALGFGIEIDVRDAQGMLMVAHDIGDARAYPFSDLCRLLRQYPLCPVAINIKSCGLQPLLKSVLEEFGIRNYFTFDMSVPDLLNNLRSGITSFTRQSEYEPEPVLYAESRGVWMDMFETDWVTGEVVLEYLKSGKDVAVVSPELHKRDYHLIWKKLMDILQVSGILENGATLYLCTDHPQEAKRYFDV